MFLRTQNVFYRRRRTSGMVLLESDSELSPGDEAPDFELPAAGGGTCALSDFDDYDALLVVFTCNHCPYAEAKVDELNHLAGAYDDLAVVGINPNDAEAYPDDSFERMEERVAAGEVGFTAYLRDESQGDGRPWRQRAVRRDRRVDSPPPTPRVPPRRGRQSGVDPSSTAPPPGREGRRGHPRTRGTPRRRSSRSRRAPRRRHSRTPRRRSRAR